MGNGQPVNGRLITERRKKKKISVNALATIAEVSPSLMRQIEDGYFPRENGEQILGRISQELGISVTALCPLRARESA